MPSDLGAGTSAEIEEERRLLYVAMTRAKDDLHLVVPQRFFVHGQHAQGDRHLYASRTRFIPEKLLPTVRADRHGLWLRLPPRRARPAKDRSARIGAACAACGAGTARPGWLAMTGSTHDSHLPV